MGHIQNHIIPLDDGFTVFQRLQNTTFSTQFITIFMPIGKIKEAFKDPDCRDDSLRVLIAGLDLFEIARRLYELNLDEKVRVFHLLGDDEKRQKFLYETDMDSRLEIQETLDRNYLAALLDEMPEDEATDIIQELPDDTQEELLSKMQGHQRPDPL